MNYRLTLKSSNRKTGPIPVSTTSNESCPRSCAFFDRGCYAKGGRVAGAWRETNAGMFSTNLDGFVAKIVALPAGQLWRHNQAGDLPGVNETIDTAALAAIVEANKGKRGFTYTHKPINETNLRAIVNANEAGFTVNLSANNLAHADQLAETGLPVVVVLPQEVHGNTKITTPAGNAVVVCPATYRDNVNCKSCGLCQRADRPVIVGFPAHGAGAKKATVVANGADLQLSGAGAKPR
jgi:hypothetical protein